MAESSNAQTKSQFPYIHMASMVALFPISCLLLILLATAVYANVQNTEKITADDLLLAFRQNKLTSKQLRELYLEKIHTQNPNLKRIIEASANKALNLADHKADYEREYKEQVRSFSGLRGINPAVGKLNSNLRRDTTMASDNYKEQVPSFSWLRGINHALEKLNSNLGRDTPMASDEFKVAVNAYLKEMETASKLEKIKELNKADALLSAAEKAASENLARQRKESMVKYLRAKNKLDALVAAGGSSFLTKKIDKILAPDGQLPRTASLQAM